MRKEITLTPQQMLEDIKTRPTVPLWPHAGWAYGLSRPGTYAAARRGDIETLKGGRRRPALTAPMREKLMIKA
jgi:hypothetical protein